MKVAKRHLTQPLSIALLCLAGAAVISILGSILFFGYNSMAFSVLGITMMASTIPYYLFIRITRNYQSENLGEVVPGEKQLLKLQEDLNKATRTAEAKSTFLSTMSHEIRTQLNAISGMTYFLMEEDPREDQLKHLEILRFSTENLQALVNDILDFNKIDAGRVKFENIDFNLAGLTNSIMESLRQKAMKNKVRLYRDLDAKLPMNLIGDPHRLNQILSNLLSNAIKFTKEGEVKLFVEWVQEEMDTLTLRFTVSDTGIGIPKEKLESIFEQFTQASVETTRKYGGTGLGLAITKKLIELQGGSLKVKSIPRKGSEFSFCLVMRKSTRYEKAKTQMANLRAAKSLKGVRLLLVEDNKINQMVARKFLFKWGIEFDMAENGHHALLKITENTYDIVLMDLNMPQMSGYEVAQKVRQMGGKFMDLPIIALTASAMKEEKMKVFEAGMDDYVVKPFNPNELHKTICKHLEIA